MKDKEPRKKETYEQLGEDISRTTSGDLVLRAREFGERFDAQGQIDGQRAWDHAVAPQEKIDKSIWSKI